MYDLMAAAGKGPNNCLTEETAMLLKAELRRLAESDFRKAGGVRSILASMLTITDALGADDAQCRSGTKSAEYALLRDKVMEIMTDLRRQYYPW
jgi:hypothetical protein